jgi:hypothetical protein
MEAHNFSLQASITTIHAQNKMKQDTKSVALARTLVQLVFSIETCTSKVTEDDMDESNEEDDSKEENKEQAVLEGMQMLSGKTSKAMLLETGKEDKWDNKGTEEREFEDPDIKMRKAAEKLAMIMDEEPSLLVDSEEDSYYTPASQKEDPIDILL